MSHWKTFGLAIFAALCLLEGTAGSADAQMYAEEWSGGHVINLGPGEAFSINNSGQSVGYSFFGGGIEAAAEWANGKVINLGGLPGSMGSEALRPGLRVASGRTGVRAKAAVPL
jgi:probable HAF family extracellular repeat protein